MFLSLGVVLPRSGRYYRPLAPLGRLGTQAGVELEEEHMGRSMKRAIAALGAVALTVGALGSGAIAQDESAFVFGGQQEPATLDAFSAVFVDEEQVIGQIFENLVYLDENIELVPGLATSWERNEDASEYTFTLREGVTFHNGDALDAAAVKAHFDRLLGDDVPGSVTSSIKNTYTGATVVDPLTVTLEFNDTQSGLLLNLSKPGGAITNAAAVAAQGPDAGSNPIGSGPFKFEEWVQGSEIRLSRNDDWTWGNADFLGTSGPANLEGITFRYLTDAQTRTASIESGDVDMIEQVPHQNLGSLRTNPDLQIVGAKFPGLPQGNFLNMQRSPFDDINVRRAVFHATDRDTIVTLTYFDEVEATYSPITQNFPQYQAGLADLYPYDPDAARALLDEAGWVVGDAGVREKDGERLTVSILENRGWNEWVTVLQDQMRDVGFDAQIHTEEGGGYFASSSSGVNEMVSMGSIDANPAQIASYLHSDQLSVGTNGGINDPVIDQMFVDMQAELDPAVLDEMLIDFQNYVMDQAYYLPIFQFNFFTAMDNDLDGMVVDGTQFYKYFANLNRS
jgi:peptide/nickel transport system substrate-binding protein